MEEHICANCQKSANFLCMRCNTEYYCSKKCQTTAFPVHRKECFSMPPLKVINGNQNMSQSSTQSSEFDDSDKNSIAGLKISEVEIKTVVEKKEDPKVENQEIKENKKEPKQTETISKEKELVTPAFNPGVRTVPPNEYKKTPSVVGATKQAVEQKKVVEEVVTEKKGLSMEAIRRNQQSVMMNQSLKKPKESRTFVNELRVRSLPMGKVKIKIVGEYESPRGFYVMEAVDGAEAFLSHIETNINDFIKTDNSKSYKPVKDEVVLAKFDEVFYRAVVEEIINDDPNKPIYGVFFIDYGNASQVTEEDLKPFSTKLKAEVILNPVFLKNLPEEITKKVGDIVSNEEGFDVDVIEKCDNCYIANILGI